MNQHTLELLPAYHDGQLDANRRKQVQEHLLTCSTCRASLEELERLSALLTSDPMPEMLNPERFASQVLLKLPRGGPLPGSRKPSSAPRWLLAAPLALIAGWAFLQAALLITGLVLWAGWVFGLPPVYLPGSLVSDLGGFLVLNLVVLAFTATFWTVWLAFWWLWNKERVFEPAPNRI